MGKLDYKIRVGYKYQQGNHKQFHNIYIFETREQPVVAV